MSEIRVTSVVGENGGDRVGLTTGLTVGPLTGTTGIGATITHQGNASFTGIVTATNVSAASSVTAATFHGSGANLTGISADYVKLAQGEQASYGGAALIFDNLDVATYMSFDLIAFLQPANDAQQLRFYYREGGASGSNITGNSYAYGFNEKKESNTSNCTAGSPDTYMRLTNTVGNHASEGVGIRMRISVGRSGDIANTKWLANLVTWDSVHREQGNAARMINGQGHLYDDTKYPTGFSLFFQSGNINNYSYTLYGIKG